MEVTEIKSSVTMTHNKHDSNGHRDHMKRDYKEVTTLILVTELKGSIKNLKKALVEPIYFNHNLNTISIEEGIDGFYLSYAFDRKGHSFKNTSVKTDGNIKFSKTNIIRYYHCFYWDDVRKKNFIALRLKGGELLQMTERESFYDKKEGHYDFIEGLGKQFFKKVQEIFVSESHNKESLEKILNRIKGLN